MNYLDKQISWFKNSFAKIPVDHTTVRTALEEIQTGRFLGAVERVRAIEDKALRSEVKKKVAPAYTFRGTFQRRKIDGIIESTGIIDIDIDNIDTTELRAWLRIHPHVLAYHNSISGHLSNGLRVLVPVEPPPSSNNECHQAFNAVCREFGLEDVADLLKDITRLSYTSYDPDLFINENAQPLLVTYATITAVPPHLDRVRQTAEEASDLITLVRDGQKHTTIVSTIGTCLRKRWSKDVAFATCRALPFESKVADSDIWDRVEYCYSHYAPGQPTSSIIRAETLRLYRAGLLPSLNGVSGSVPDSISSQADERESAQSAQSAQSALCPSDKFEGTLNDVLAWKNFPTYCLPAPCAEYATAMGRALGCNEAYLTLPMLAVLAAGVGNTSRIRIKHSWNEPSTLWIVLLGRSGTMKSPAVHSAILPVLELERRAGQDFTQAKEEYEYALERYKVLSKTARTQEAPPIMPHRRRYRLHDATIESAGMLHSENPRGLLLARDELAGWIGSFDRYANGDADMQSWIEMYEGRYTQIDRKSGDPPTIDVPFPAISVIGTMQPGIFSEKISAKHFESGFAVRLLIAHPPEMLRQWTSADVMPEVRGDYFRLVKTLYEYPCSEQPELIDLRGEALRLFAEFVNENAALMNRLPEGALRSILSKIEAIAARIALSLHLAESSGQIPGNITEDVMGRAIEIARWFRHEIARIHQREAFEERELSRDERNIRELPTDFTWEDVARVWGVSRRATYKVIKRMILKGLVEDKQHGSFSKCPKGTVHFGHFGHNDTDQKEDDKEGV